MLYRAPATSICMLACTCIPYTCSESHALLLILFYKSHALLSMMDQLVDQVYFLEKCCTTCGVIRSFLDIKINLCVADFALWSIYWVGNLCSVGRKADNESLLLIMTNGAESDMFPLTVVCGFIQAKGCRTVVISLCLNTDRSWDSIIRHLIIENINKETDILIHVVCLKICLYLYYPVSCSINFQTLSLPVASSCLVRSVVCKLYSISSHQYVLLHCFLEIVGAQNQILTRTVHSSVTLSAAARVIVVVARNITSGRVTLLFSFVSSFSDEQSKSVAAARVVPRGGIPKSRQVAMPANFTLPILSLRVIM